MHGLWRQSVSENFKEWNFCSFKISSTTNDIENEKLERKMSKGPLPGAIIDLLAFVTVLVDGIVFIIKKIKSRKVYELTKPLFSNNSSVLDI